MGAVVDSLLTHQSHKAMTMKKHKRSETPRHTTKTISTKTTIPATPRRRLPLRFSESWLPICYSICFALIAWFFLYVRNADTLYFMQDRGWWNSTSLFFRECVRAPGGLLSWTGAYLTQYFFYPALGSVILILVWLLTFWIAKFSFCVPNRWSFLLLVPQVALLASNIQLGYWIYIIRDIDYTFYHSLGLMAAIVFSLPFWQILPIPEKARQGIALIWIPAIALLGYNAFGIYALLASAIVGVRLLATNPFWGLGAILTTILTIWIVPGILTADCTIMKADQAWTYGFRYFLVNDKHDTFLEAPFFMALASPLLFPFYVMLNNVRKSYLWSAVLAIATGVSVLWLLSRDFTDYNFHAELRMQRAVEEHRWNDVLREASAAKEPVTREMIMFRDIALFNLNLLNDRRYTYNNRSIPPATVSDSINIRITDQAGDLIYYNFGETCFAIRRAIERCMHFGFGHYTLRMLTQCALINGEYDNARKYLRLLSRTTFQKEWADKTLPYLNNPSRIAQSERFKIPMLMYNEGTSLLGTDDDFVEQTLLTKWMHSNTTDPTAQQFALSCAMELRDVKLFWAQVQRYFVLNPGKPFPKHVQEAMLFYYYELKSTGVNLSVVQFDDIVKNRYQAFFQRMNQFVRQGMDEEQIGNALRPEFGDTYMWDYCILRAVQTN